jgi:hypothetical protein
MDFKWETLLLKSCMSFKPIQFGHQFDLIWIWHEGVIHFRSWGKSLVQLYWSEMTYNVSSCHMHLKVEFALPLNIKVELDILNLIMKFEWISYHKYWASYGLEKLTSKPGFRKNDL